MDNYTVRFIIAVGIGCAAAFLNYLWMQQNVPQIEYFVAVARDIEKGRNIVKEDLQLIQLPAAGESLDYTKYFIPYGDRFSLIDRPASRDFKKNEIFRDADFTESDYLPDVDILGPFRLLSIGNQLAGSKSTGTQNFGGRVPITFIVKMVKNPQTGVEEFEPQTRRLLQLINYENAADSRSGAGRSDWRLMHIIAYPDNAPGSSPAKDPEEPVTYQLAEDEYAIIVEVPNVPMLMNVLMNSKKPRIGFVVPSGVVKSAVMETAK